MIRVKRASLSDYFGKRNLPIENMLESVPVFVLILGNYDLLPLELARLQSEQRVGCWLPVVRHEHDEAQGLGTVAQ